MAKKYNRTLTDDYPVCMHGDCPMADKCLHRKAFSMLTETSKMLRLINPTLCSKDERCEFYRSDAPVIFARGFEGFQKSMYPEQYDKFMRTLIMHFGRNQYYMRRRGDIRMPPDEQDAVRYVLEQVGADRNMEFDNYEEQIDW